MPKSLFVAVLHAETIFCSQNACHFYVDQLSQPLFWGDIGIFHTPHKNTPFCRPWESIVILHKMATFVCFQHAIF
jgi:hypothetical protein